MNQETKAAYEQIKGLEAKEKQAISERERELKIMQAGLTLLPDETDFVHAQIEKLVVRKGRYEAMSGIITLVDRLEAARNPEEVNGNG